MIFMPRSEHPHWNLLTAIYAGRAQGFHGLVTNRKRVVLDFRRSQFETFLQATKSSIYEVIFFLSYMLLKLGSSKHDLTAAVALST